MKSKIALGIILSGMALATLPSANAATATGTFNVTITILKACSVTAGGSNNIALGSVNSTAVNTSGTTNISVTCSKTTPYFIGLLPSSANGGTTSGAGSMASVANSATNTDKVPYQLYSNAALTTVWGNTASTTLVGNGVAGTGTGAAQTIPVYAQAASANFTPDSYTDVVAVTVNY